MTLSDIQSVDIQVTRLISQVDDNELYCAILESLIIAVFQDLQKQTIRVDRQELGWRNKYNIHLISGVSQKQIYKECGVLEDLIEQGIIEMRPSPSKWGKQKHHYRLCLSKWLQSDFSRLGQ